MKKIILLLVLCILCVQIGICQQSDSIKPTSHFSGVITVTNNGISLIPSFSLGKPAVLFDLSVGKGKWSFDPMLRFGINGKPWAFIFWWRYKLVTTPKFKMSVGAHPSFVFRDVSVTQNGITKNYLNTQRFFAWEATPTYFVHNKIGLGMHYLGSHGLTKDIVQYTHFIAFRTFFNHIPLSHQFDVTFIPQAFYLKMDKLEGKYVNATVILAKKNLPVTFSTIVSKAINTEIAGKDFIWSLALNYNFNKTYVLRK